MAVERMCKKSNARWIRNQHIAPGHVTSLTLVTCSNRVSTTCGHMHGSGMPQVGKATMLCPPPFFTSQQWSAWFPEC